MKIKNLLNFARKNKKVFTMFMIVNIATIVAFLSVFNYSLLFIENTKSLQKECRTYSAKIIVMEDIDICMKELYDIYGESFYDYYALIEKEDNNIRCQYMPVSDEEINVGQNFSEQDIKDGTKKIISFDESGTEKNGYRIGTKYDFDGTLYDVIGISYFDDLIVPYNSLKNKSDISSITVVLNKDFSSAANEIFINNLKKIFHTQDIKLPSPYSKNTYESAINYVSVFCIVVLISVINIVYLYSYIMNKRKKEMAVFRLCGCNMSNIISMYFSELLILSVVSYIFALILHFAVVMPTMSAITSSMKLYTGIFDLIIIYAAYLLIETVTFLPLVYRIGKTSPSVLNKE